MKTRWIGRFVLMAVVATSGCGIPYVAGASFDPTLQLGEPATFAWDVADAFPTGDPRLDNDALVVGRLRGAVEREFAARGVRHSLGSGDLLVHYHLTVRDRVAVLEADRGAGYSTQYGPGTHVYQYDEGTFLIDVADGATKQIVWRGWARADLAGLLDNPEAMIELIDRSVVGMFERFPLPVGRQPVTEPLPPPGLFPAGESRPRCSLPIQPHHR